MKLTDFSWGFAKDMLLILLIYLVLVAGLLVMVIVKERKKEKEMDPVWRNIFRKYIDSYKAIQTLHENGILDEEEKAVHEHNLLYNIMVTMESEVEE